MAVPPINIEALRRQANMKGLGRGLGALGAGLIQMGAPSTRLPGDRPGLLDAYQGYQQGFQSGYGQVMNQPMEDAKLAQLQSEAEQRQRMADARAAFKPGELGYLDPVAAGTVAAESAARQSIADQALVDVFVPGKGNQKMTVASARLMGYAPAVSVPTGMTPTETGGFEYDPGYLAGQEQIARASTEAANAGLALTPAQKALDIKYVEDFNSWAIQGGRADTFKGIEQIRGVQERLAAGEPLTGVKVGFQPDRALALTNPAALAAKNDVEEVVQRNLKTVLGSQFTEGEGNRLIARAYNMDLSPEINAIRLGRLLDAIEAAARQKDAAAQYFNQWGTLKGFDAYGVMPTIESIEAAAFGDSEDGWSVEEVD